MKRKSPDELKRFVDPGETTTEETTEETASEETATTEETAAAE